MLIKLIKEIPKQLALKFDQLFKSSPCPICKRPAILIDSIDFNKSCEDRKVKIFEKRNLFIKYHLCSNCGHCFAPVFQNWSEDAFSKEIYNDQYPLVDPDYLHDRPHRNKNFLQQILGSAIQSNPSLRHLDYGGGSGLLSKLLKESGWTSTSHDQFVDKSTKISDLGQFDIITAFEVFEHIPNHDAFFDDLNALAHESTLLVFSTLLSNGEIHAGRPLSWWYAAPRNGHVSLFSLDSLSLMLSQHGYTLKSLNQGVHLAWKSQPEWLK